ncbi:MAG: response regulator [Candidatus Nomurabacteria bacterium]|nr:MAG: response regulator [Candidatus Nomurabacteria bacterium]
MQSTKTILVIEDDPSIRQALCQKLSKEKYTCLEAPDGMAGLNVAFSKHPDLILLDIVMPKMDGMTMLEKLREDDWGKNVKVMILTNLDYAGEKDKAIAGGVSQFIVKSEWTLEDIIKKIKEGLK